MAKHEVICRVCKQKFDTNSLREGVDWIKPEPNYYYHTKCYNDWKTKKKSFGTGTEAIENDTLWLDAAYDYLVKDLLMPMDYGKMRSQWNRLLKKGRTPKGIYFAVRYFYEIEKGDKAKANGGIGIIDYVYDRSAQYWANRERNGERILAQIEEQVKALHARETTVIERKRKPKKQKKVIDLNMIEDWEN